MAKLSKLLVVNVGVFILFLIQAVTGGWIWIDILGGFRPPLALLRFHPISGIVLTVFILLHIYLNWKWIKVQLLNQKLYETGGSSK
jgi:cytochrome b subunit of formate dehydrogenase